MNSGCIEQLETCAEWRQQTILSWLEDAATEEETISSPEMSGSLNSRVYEDSVVSTLVPASSSSPSTNRRSSLAVSLHSNLTSFGAAVGPASNDLTALQVVGSARRRLSNVSDVVSRKISHTIGWRTLSASIDQTVSQGSSLCAQYIRHRLKRSGIFHRKLGLRRMRSATLLPGGAVVTEVLPELVAVGSELEKMHPALFIRIGRQIGRGNFVGEQTACEAIVDVAREVIRNGEMTWSKVIALYAVAGGIAVDCVRQGKPEYLPAIQRGMTDVLEEDLAPWIQANGGWTALAVRYRPPPKPTAWKTHKLTIIFFLSAFCLGVISIILRLFIF